MLFYHIKRKETYTILQLDKTTEHVTIPAQYLVSLKLNLFCLCSPKLDFPFTLAFPEGPNFPPSKSARKLIIGFDYSSISPLKLMYLKPMYLSPLPTSTNLDYHQFASIITKQPIGFSCSYFFNLLILSLYYNQNVLYKTQL